MTTAASKPQLQRRLALKVEIDAPLLDVNAARAILAVDADSVSALVDAGKIAWVFDIGLSNTQRELRLLAKCVRGFATTGKSCGLEHEKLDGIIAWILAKDQKPFIPARRVAQLFLCERKHIIHLIEEGELKVVKDTTWRRGRGGSALVTGESVVNFLKRRKQ